MFIMPFPSVPDENRHFLKIYGMSEGIFVPSDSVSLPGNLDFKNQYDFKYAKAEQDSDRTADYSNMHWYDLSSTTLYFPLVYTPQTVGVAAAKLFTGNIYSICLTGRIFGYIFNVFMVCMAIKLMPFKKELIFMTAMLPIYMQESVSLAGDSVENAMILVFIAYIFAMKYGGEKRKWPLFVMAPLIGLCKMFYLPLILLVFLIDEKMIMKICIAAESLVLNALWLLSASGQPSHYNTGADGSRQAAYICSDPFRYIGIIMNTSVLNARTWVRQAFGGNLGWIAVNVCMPFILIYILIMFYTALCRSGEALKGRDRALILITDLMVFIIVLTGEYLQWTQVGAAAIDGVQGRYFVPLIFITLMCLANRRLRLPDRYLRQVIFVYSAVYNIIALVTVYRAFS